MEIENLKKIVEYIKEKVIGKKRTIEELKNELLEKFDLEKKDIIEETKKYIFIKLNIILQENKEGKVTFKNLYIVFQNDIVKCIILEQEYNAIVSNSVKQRYYYDKENELFVSTVKIETSMLFSLNYETMIKYNGKFIYQDRYKKREEGEEFNNKIFNQIVNEETSIADIAEEYNSEII